MEEKEKSLRNMLKNQEIKLEVIDLQFTPPLFRFEFSKEGRTVVYLNKSKNIKLAYCLGAVKHLSN